MTLTKTEARVLARLVRGESDAEIAEAVQLRHRTVKYYVGRLLQIFGADNRTRLIAMYWQAERQAVLDSLVDLQKRVKTRAGDVPDRLEEVVRMLKRDPSKAIEAQGT